MSSGILSDVANGSPSVTLVAISRALAAGDVTSRELVREYAERYQSDRSSPHPINGYVEFFEHAEEDAKSADELRQHGDTRPLLGLPIAVKDNIHIEGELLTCASRILEGYRAPYSATVIERLQDAGAVLLGRTNMDEFAMGSSCEYSIYGPSRNPLDRRLTCGGSSGGSAAVVAGGQAPFSLGSDTGGSIRLPASFCGIYGLKPTYGALSRYGLVAFGSSLDQIGFFGHSPLDLALVLESTAGADPRDETSADYAFRRFEMTDLAGRSVAVPEELMGVGIDPEVVTLFEEFVEWLKSLGARVDRASFPNLDACLAVYYIIASAEASSNLSRYDGVKFGYRDESGSTLGEMYESTRMSGFGEEVKRRILSGNYVLSSGYYDAYYKKAQAVRRILREQVEKCFVDYDWIVSPTSPTPAFPLGRHSNEPLSMYLTDVCTTFANLTESPSISIPFGNNRAGLPVGVQVTGPRFGDSKLIGPANLFYEQSSRVDV